MQFRFTPAAQRAIDSAAEWSLGSNDELLDVPALLLGLLAETECRAAMMLAASGIDAEVVRARWTKLSAVTDRDVIPFAKPFSPQLAYSLRLACERLADLPAPLELATEHLLLGLVAADHDDAEWLREQGLNPDAIKAEILRINGLDPRPLPIDDAPLPPIDLMDTPDTTAGLPSSACDASGPLRAGATAGLPSSAFENCPENTAGQAGGGTRKSRIQRFQQAADQPGNEAIIPVLRVIDAAANRAREGIRVVEDFVRFVLDDRHLTDRCKQLRHDLSAALTPLAKENLLAARETLADVGTTLSTPAETRRENMASVVGANLARLQESLRSLEEFGKRIDPAMAERFKQLRYRAYTLDRAVETTRTSLERLGNARLYVLIDGGESPEEFLRRVGALLASGVDVLQLRDKRLDDRALLQRARLLREATREADTLFIMNDRPDLAALARADGVHLGQEELTIKDARTIVGPGPLIGVSTHSIDQARRAQLDGANYIGVGPTFPSGTKTFESFPGLDLLRDVALEIRLPAFAIGGISQDNLPEVLATGIGRVALSGAVAKAADPGETVRALRRQIMTTVGSSSSP